MTAATAPSPEPLAAGPDPVAARVAEIRARAAARGLPLPPPGPPPGPPPTAPANCPRPRPVTSHRSPVTGAPAQPPACPWRLAAHQRPPQAWRRHRDRWSHSGPNSRETAAACELRLVARQIAACLGPDWRAERPDHEARRGRNSLVHVPTGARIAFGYEWNTLERFRAVPDIRGRRDQLPAHITMDGRRTPASLAADIHRRIIAAGLVAAHVAEEGARREQRAAYIERVQTIMRIARAAGTTLGERRYWKSQQDPELAWGPFGCRYQYGERLKLSIETADPGLAEHLAAAWRAYEPPPQQPEQQPEQQPGQQPGQLPADQQPAA